MCLKKGLRLEWLGAVGSSGVRAWPVEWFTVVSLLSVARHCGGGVWDRCEGEQGRVSTRQGRIGQGLGKEWA